MTSPDIHEGDFFKHFKGQIYQIKALAANSEDETPMVVYQAMYPPFKTWVRPLSMFLQKLDTSKYPDAAQTYRFEKISFDNSTSNPKNNVGQDNAFSSAVSSSGMQDTLTVPHASPDKHDIPENEDNIISEELTISDDEITEALLSGQVERKLSGRLSDSQLASKGFMIFLDADNYHDKRQIFLNLRQYLSDTMLNNIAVTLDLVLDDGSKEQHFDTILNCLETHEHYECNRLR